MTINEAQDEIIEEFEFFDDWIGRYELLIEYGKKLKPLPESDKTDQNLIDGCQSKVWLTAQLQGGVIHFTGDSDAVLVKGIVALMLQVLNDHTPKDILSADLYFISFVIIVLSPFLRAGALILTRGRARGRSVLHAPLRAQKDTVSGRKPEIY